MKRIKDRKGDWQFNHRAIRKAIIAFVKKYGERPTNAEIARLTKLSIPTVERHVREMRFKTEDHPLRALSEEVLLNIFASSKKSPASQKLWFQLMEGFSEKVQNDLTSQGERINEISSIRVEIVDPRPRGGSPEDPEISEGDLPEAEA
jgi:hypothetical protein